MFRHFGCGFAALCLRDFVVHLRNPGAKMWRWPGMRHRKLRHHLAGIEQVRKLWGDQAAAAARLHIISDLKQEGWTEDQPFPRDEQHYQQMGLF